MTTLRISDNDSATKDVIKYILLLKFVNVYRSSNAKCLLCKASSMFLL